MKHALIAAVTSLLFVAATASADPPPLPSNEQVEMVYEMYESYCADTTDQGAYVVIDGWCHSRVVCVMGGQWSDRILTVTLDHDFGWLGINSEPISSHVFMP